MEGGDLLHDPRLQMLRREINAPPNRLLSAKRCGERTRCHTTEQWEQDEWLRRQLLEGGITGELHVEMMERWIHGGA